MTGPEFNMTSISSKEATVEIVKETLIRDGGIIIRNFTKQEDLDQIEKDLRPYIEEQGSWGGEFFPKESRRVCGMVGKSRTAAEKIIGNELYNDVCEIFLSDAIKAYWGNEQLTSISKPQLNNSIVFSILPGARAQDLHRDDYIHHNHLKELKGPEEYTFDRDSGIGLFVAGKKTTKENGATRFIPYSHLTGLECPPDESKVVYAELNPGDAFMMLASCYHGGSANNSKDEERLLYSCFITRGYLRQEENQYLATPLEVVKKYPRRLQELMGYSISKPYLGWLDLQDPIKVLGVDVSNNDLF